MRRVTDLENSVEGLSKAGTSFASRAKVILAENGQRMSSQLQNRKDEAGLWVRCHAHDFRHAASQLTSRACSVRARAW